MCYNRFMFPPVLVTKFFIPTVRPKLVQRHRLIDQLSSGGKKKLTLISAPAGFGKTTLVIDWLNQITQTQKMINDGHESTGVLGLPRVAWLSLDDGDNDPTRFLMYLTTALKRIDTTAPIGDAALAMLASAQSVPPETVMTLLINEVAKTPEEIYFILDDYHVIENQAIHRSLAFLLKNLPPKLHIVITTREDPLLPLARLRALGQIAELRAVDLRFSIDEATEFLNYVMGLDLSPENIAALESRTEGWIGGLQLAAISLQGQTNADQLIHAFTGSNRLILDYLIEEVLRRQTQEIQEFLLHTSVLNRLSGELCDHVRLATGQSANGQENSQAVLEALEHANIFLIPLDGERKWFRYHHLFADLLQQQLYRENPQVIPGLHQRASQWFEANNLIEEAIQHAFLAGDYERSALLLADLADPLWERGQHVKLRDWLAKLPEKNLSTKPQLAVYWAWFLFSTGQQEAAHHLLQEVENQIEDLEHRIDQGDSGSIRTLEWAERSKILGRLWAIWALICTWREDLSGVIQHANSALENLPSGDPWRRMAVMALGDAIYYRGDVLAAYRTRLETLEASLPEDDLFFYMIANLKVATSLREMGKLKDTMDICRQQVDFAKHHGLTNTIFVGWAYTLWSLALAERNELAQALKYAKKSLALTLGGDFAFLSFSYIVLAKIYFYLGEFDQAEDHLKKLADLGRSHDIPFYTKGSMKSWQGRIMLARGHLDDAEQWIAGQDFGSHEESFITFDHINLIKARLLLAREQWAEAHRLLMKMRELCEKVGHTGRMIEILVLLSLTLQGMGETSQALQTLEQAVALAEPGGFVRVFVDEGPPMARLLYEMLSGDQSRPFVQHLLEAFPAEESTPLEAEPVQDPEGVWIEQLTDRELEVLELIAEGLTNQAIGNRLFLSLNTVKAHTRNIYGKLGVSSRTQAVSKGRTLGILTDQ